MRAADPDPPPLPSAPPIEPIATPASPSIAGPDGEGAVAERVGQHLLEVLDSLDAVYRSAAYFAELAGESSIGDYTLARCLEAVHTDSGAVFVAADDGLRLHGQRGSAAPLLCAAALAAPWVTARPAFHHGDDARRLLHDGAPPHGVLTAPIHVGARLLGMVALLAPPPRTFTTGEVKLVDAVASQAAIALSRAQQHHAAEIERQKLRLVVQNHADGIAVLDLDGAVTLCNPVAREFCGSGDVLDALQAADPTCTLATLVRSPTARELTLDAPSRRRVVSVASRPVLDGDGRVANVLLTMRDVTHGRREEQLKRDFLSLISHKLRTPVTILAGALQMLGAAEPAERELYVDEMSRRVQDLGALIDRLLYFAELLTGSWSGGGVTDLHRLAADVDAHFRSAHAGVPLQLVWSIDAAAASVPVPASRLRVALVDLIDNAIKFGPRDRPWVRVTARAEGGAIVLEVEDRGPGIPADQRQGLFAAGQQLEVDFTGNVPGAGVGLAMVHEITTRLGGTLELRDAEPHGCVWVLCFPRPQTPEAP